MDFTENKLQQKGAILLLLEVTVTRQPVPLPLPWDTFSKKNLSAL